MKNFIFLPAIFLFVFIPKDLEAFSSNLNYQIIKYNNFLMSYDCFYVDSIIYPFCTKMSSGSDQNYIEVTNLYFEDFDYEPNLEFQLLTPQHQKDAISIYDEEDVVFRVVHNDVVNNAPQESYPRILLKFPDSSTKTYTMNKNDAIDKYKASYTYTLKLDKGTYEYKYITTNKYENNLFEVKGDWHVTSRPYNFIKRTPHSMFEEMPDNVCFSWDIASDEKDDKLSYELYLGFESKKSELKKVEQCPCINCLSHSVSKLQHKKKYYWYMVVKNKFGVPLETEMFSFFTGGLVDKFYNAPNPFNPSIGTVTDFVFPMYYDGNAQIKIYSEFGDLVWESDKSFFDGNTTGNIKYDGRDNSGRLLYNGSYIAILTKKYGDKTEIERCRILIIK
ncbi:MAG: hypothetical protein LBD57_03815 [Endomicrobium sp.]|jgi:hypothetical protein|uniref:hypothetical protein n=1 Tax=Candidatus Endomicrobiellum cubanum TaxID=3242325 RepID=UPI002824FA49|nr:hypothetical protein [Endomicrobium sp.]